jgi:hypothetical protein
MDHKIFAKRCTTSLPSQQHTQPTICFIDTHRLPQDCERQVQSLRDLPSLLNATKCQRSPSHSRFHRSVLYSAFPPRTPRTVDCFKAAYLCTSQECNKAEKLQPVTKEEAMSKSQQKRKFATLGNSFRLGDYQEPDRVCQNFPHSEHANNAIGANKISRE